MKIIFPPMSKNNNIKIMLMQEFIKIFRNFDWQRFRLAESPFLTIFFSVSYRISLPVIPTRKGKSIQNTPLGTFPHGYICFNPVITT